MLHVYYVYIGFLLLTLLLSNQRLCVLYFIFFIHQISGGNSNVKNNENEIKYTKGTEKCNSTFYLSSLLPTKVPVC